MALAIHLNSTTDVQHFTKFLLTGSSVIGRILTAMTGAILRARFRYYGRSSLLASDWRPEVFSWQNSVSRFVHGHGGWVK